MKRLGVDFGHRMTVIESPAGPILHSPVAIDEGPGAEWGGPGAVAAVIAPSLFHDLYLAPYFERYPGARFMCSPGFRAAHPDLPFQEELSVATVRSLDAGLEVALIEGMPRVNECVFLHVPSRSLIVADLVFNLRGSYGPFARLFLGLNSVHHRVAASRFFRLFIRDRVRFRHSLEQVLEWDFDRIVVGHGEIVESGGRQALREAYAWLLRRG